MEGRNCWRSMSFVLMTPSALTRSWKKHLSVSLSWWAGSHLPCFTICWDFFFDIHLVNAMKGSIFLSLVCDCLNSNILFLGCIPCTALIENACSWDWRTTSWEGWKSGRSLPTKYVMSCAELWILPVLLHHALILSTALSEVPLLSFFFWCNSNWIKSWKVGFSKMAAS
jgi:hypothetical protein